MVITVERPVAVRLVSFGYAHGRPVPDAHIVLDLRAHFGDSSAPCDFTDPESLVAETDGLPELVEGVIPVLAAFRSGCGAAAGDAPVAVAVAVGCADGRLAAGVAAAVRRRTDSRLVRVAVEHRGPGGRQGRGQGS
ncbi:ATPase [Streptomyces sp. MAR4 CNX-425]|uniref:ATPase n=1 Tax=Streptomyces sp. MAR4 CNX-425 TaxID=3406343 RepID=UPI003B50B6B7